MASVAARPQRKYGNRVTPPGQLKLFRTENELVLSERKKTKNWRVHLDSKFLKLRPNLGQLHRKCAMADRISEQEAKHFYETGVDLAVPASVKINSKLIPRIRERRRKKNGKEVSMGFYTAFRFYQKVALLKSYTNGKRLDKGRTVNLRLYETEE